MIGNVLVEGFTFEEYDKKLEAKIINLEKFGVLPDEENKYGYLKLNSQRIRMRDK